MTSPLAKIYSSVDSWKRALSDMLTNPAAHAEKAIGHGLDQSRAFREKLGTANINSVLVSEEQKTAARNSTADSMLNLLAGNAGIIVPVGAVSPAFRATAKTHVQPLSGQLAVTVPDSAQKLDKDLLKPAGTGKDFQPLVLPIEGFTAADFLRSHANYPSDLLQYLSNVTVHPGSGVRTSGSFSARDDRIILSPGTPKELMSTLLHEIQHSAQYLYDMPNGGSPREFYQNYGKFSTADELVKQRLKELKLSPAGADLPMASFPLSTREELFKSPEALQFVNKYLYDTKVQAHRNYQRLGGEVESRLVQNMFENNNYTDPVSTILSRDMGVDAAAIMPRSDIKKNLVDTEPALQGILDLVLGVKP